MRAEHKNKGIRFASFSGIDGAGKSTQIQRFRLRIEQAGLRCCVVSFWDDVTRFKGLRERASHWIFKGDRGVGTPSAPIARRDKNVRSWSMTGLRLCLYLADVMSVRMLMRRMSQSKVDVVIFDRFIYDELANLDLVNPIMRAYARAMLNSVPRLHISFLLDADPAEARARKPEYPLDFLEFGRKNYLVLSKLTGCMTIIAPKPADELEQEVFNRAAAAFCDGTVRDIRAGGEGLVEGAQ